MRFSSASDQDPFGYQQVTKIWNFSIKEPARGVEKITILGSHLRVGNGALLRTKLPKQPSIISRTYLHHRAKQILRGFWMQWITWLLHKWIALYAKGIIRRRSSKPCFRFTQTRLYVPFFLSEVLAYCGSRCNNCSPFNFKLWSYVAKDELCPYYIDPKK